MGVSDTSNLVADTAMESDHQIKDGSMSINSLKSLSYKWKPKIDFIFVYNWHLRDMLISNGYFGDD